MTTSKNNFLAQIIEDELSQKTIEKVFTRFPPEPNGYLHIGHAKSIVLNFGLALEFGGKCNLRFDDTNPAKEEQEFIDSICEDVKWLGFEWQGNIKFTSDYFDQLYDWAIYLIKNNKAFVCDLNSEQTRQMRGTLTQAGENSPFRDRSVEENLALFAAMKNGEFGEGEKVLRAKIDMASPNINLRDPVLYRIRHLEHHQTGTKWCIYPSYDFAHGQSDAIEGISHSICTLEFEDHRPLYNWLIENLPIESKPRQFEFARLNLTNTITSKRKLKQLVDEKIVEGWDDARMPTIAGLRRRGFTPNSIKNFCEVIGVTRSDSRIDIRVLHNELRQDLETTAHRAMCVLNPIKVEITNWREDLDHNLEFASHPNNPEFGTRKMQFSRELWIDADDFMLDAPKKFFRLAPNKEVRLRHSYIIKCEEVVFDGDKIEKLLCSVDWDTLGKNPEDRKVKGVIHWVTGENPLKVECNLYEELFLDENPEASEDFLASLNPNSLQVVQALAEPSLANSDLDLRYQFERVGYFVADAKKSTQDKKVFNKIVGLRDSWAKINN